MEESILPIPKFKYRSHCPPKKRVTIELRDCLLNTLIEYT